MTILAAQRACANPPRKAASKSTHSSDKYAITLVTILEDAAVVA
jgi:hypothetical protein